MTAIDVTKGVPFTDDVADHEDDILGYRHGNEYFQWAVLKIFGRDVPLVLRYPARARTVRKDAIVKKLLSHATKMVDIDLVMMDREFDSESVKDTCEEYGVHFLNPTRIFERSDEAATIAWMYHNGKRFHVTEEESDDGTHTRKQMYLPQRSNSDNDDENDSLSEVWTEMCGKWVLKDVEGEPSSRMPFSRLFADIQRKEELKERKQKAQDGDVDTAETDVFETNYLYVTARDASDQQMDGKAFIHMIERLIRGIATAGYREWLQETTALHGANHLDRARLSLLQFRVRVRIVQCLATRRSAGETRHRWREQVLCAAGGRESVSDRGKAVLRSRPTRLTPRSYPVIVRVVSDSTGEAVFIP